MIQRSSGWYEDDDQLLAALRDALREDAPAPEAMLADAKAAYTWRTVDAELATLRYDSILDNDILTQVRSGTDDRSLTFETNGLSVEMFVEDDSLTGQIVPASAGEVQIQVLGGELGRMQIDERGLFYVRPVPHTVFRLLFQPDTGSNVITDWVRL